jgi:hypothetical protein
MEMGLLSITSMEAGSDRSVLNKSLEAVRTRQPGKMPPQELSWQ